MDEHQTQSIVENLWWVIPGNLAGVRKPTAEEISELQSVGIGAIVSVMDDPSNLDLYQAASLPYLWLPTKGGTAPSQDHLQDLQSFVEQQNQMGQAVAVHCTSGRRRTGTFLAAYLIQTGLAYEQAMQTILAANSMLDLREAQLSFLRSLATG
jgi:atypical dual specificity phosphatase